MGGYVAECGVEPTARLHASGWAITPGLKARAVLVSCRLFAGASRPGPASHQPQAAPSEGSSCLETHASTSQPATPQLATPQRSQFETSSDEGGRPEEQMQSCPRDVELPARCRAARAM
jgi:hypothetical protein